jgi:hypothetical protein
VTFSAHNPINSRLNYSGHIGTDVSGNFSWVISGTSISCSFYDSNLPGATSCSIVLDMVPDVSANWCSFPSLPSGPRCPGLACWASSPCAAVRLSG